MNTAADIRKFVGFPASREGLISLGRTHSWDYLKSPKRGGIAIAESP